MVIELDGRDTLKVTLDRRDMHRLNITFEELDYGSPGTQEVLRELLADAGRLTGFCRSKISKMLIEVFPAPAGGCLLYFTKLAGPKAAEPDDIQNKNKSGVYVYEFDCGGDLLAATEYIDRMKHLPKPTNRRIYYKDKAFRVALDWEIPPKRAGEVLCEFCRFVGEGKFALALTDEHWRRGVDSR